MMPTLLPLFLVFASSSHAFFLPSNVSHILLSHEPVSSHVSPLSCPPLLEDVVRAVAKKEQWDPAGQVRVSAAADARVGSSQRYESHVRVGPASLVLRFHDEAVSWGKPGSAELGHDLVVAGPRPPVRPLLLEGPLEFIGDELSLHLTAANITHRVLRRVLVGDGITINILGAHEISLFHPYNIGPFLNGSLAQHNKDRSQFQLLNYDSCAPLPTVHIVGSSSLVAHRTRNSEAYIETALRSYDTIELLPDKCHSQEHWKHSWSCSFCAVSSRLALVEKVLRGLLGYRILQSRSTRFIKAKITSTTLVKFQLELERDITENDRIWKKAADWRTKPSTERALFNIVARVDGGSRLKPVVLKKLKSPYVARDSTAWGNLMFNISFTEFSSFVVPPEALTLDVKW